MAEFRPRLVRIDLRQVTYATTSFFGAMAGLLKLQKLGIGFIASVSDPHIHECIKIIRWDMSSLDGKYWVNGTAYLLLKAGKIQPLP